ncbi:MAG: methylmalonyl-CoA mutase family protein [Dysgonamonadaceae bacterium]|jgi:methylmalonyl-CoA mutase|nr:methylmalonyl-CoA mutase family protein [Dysgonamonadaceae bacterium]
MSNSKEKLFPEFPPVSTEKWKEKIIADLKGADFEKKLVWKTNEGFNVNPFYRTEDIDGLKTTESLPGEFPYVRGTQKDNDWFVRQDIAVTDFAKANQKALDVLNKGVTSLGFEIPGEKVSKENIALLLAGILPEHIELNFTTCNLQSVALTRILVEYFKEKNYDLTKIRGSVNIDFIGTILSKGVVKEEWIQEMTAAIQAAAELRYFKLIAVNAYLFNNAGSFITQELGYALAWGNEILSRLTKEGVDPALAAKKIKFNFGAGSNYFMEIAKFRAARWLWAEIVKAYTPTCHYDCPNEGAGHECRCSAKMNLFAQTSTFNQTVFDAHVNLLRTQTEAMSASLAGVDSLRVSSFDESFKTPDEFSERIARNQQLLLKEECHFDKIVDPSGGSYYIETLTVSIAQEAWKLFLETEEKGFYELVKTGEIQAAVNASAEKRFKALAQRREILLGTNQFPNFTEKASGKTKQTPQADACSCSTGHEPITLLNKKRLGEPFETLRLSTENSGKEIKAFMLTIGNLAMRLARSQFSSNFLACAGYKVIDNLGFETVEQGVKAAREAQADIIVLCSSDDEYAVFAPEAHRLTGGKEILIIAGAPACSDELKAQGITNFINVRSNVLETLQELNTKLVREDAKTL